MGLSYKKATYLVAFLCVRISWLVDVFRLSVFFESSVIGSKCKILQGIGFRISMLPSMY